MTNNSFTRKQILEQFFEGIEDAETHLTATCKALELKPNAKSFTGEHSHRISVSREWTNSGEASDYEQIADLWSQRKDQIKSDYESQQNALTAQSESVVNSDELATTDGGIQNPLVVPAQISLSTGQQVGAHIRTRLASHVNAVNSVVDTAFSHGLNQGINEPVDDELSLGNEGDALDVQKLTQDALKAALGEPQ